MEKLKKQMNNDFKIHLLPEEVKISTITMVCRLPTKFNCSNIATYFPLEYDGIINIIHGKFGDIKTNRSLIKKKARKNNKKKKKNFFNQTTLIIHVKTKIKPINVKLFTDGAIQMTGCACVDDIFEILTKVFMELKRKILDDDGNFVNFVGKVSAIKMNKLSNLKISMINSNFRMPVCIDRQKLYNLLLSEDYYCIYDPVKHACVNIKYNCSDHQISIFVFEKGAIIITGALHCGQIAEAYVFINKYILENLPKIEKNSLVFLDDL